VLERANDKVLIVSDKGTPVSV